MAAAIARMRQQQRPTKANGNVNHAPRQQQNNDGHGHSHVFDEWSAHVRYFLAQYPLDARPFVAQRLAAFGIRSLLSSHRQESLTLDALASATDAADKDVLSLMRQHARGRQKQRGGGGGGGKGGVAGSGFRRGFPTRETAAAANAGVAPPPPQVLRERGSAGNVQAGPRGAAGGTRRRAVAGRPDVLTRYPFVDDLAGTEGGGVGAALHRATPTTPIQNLAKREIKRLAHEAFRELKASALGIRLSDLPSALQFLFFGDSASLLTAKGGARGDGGGDGGGGPRVAGRSAKDVHLVMALARECLPPTLALAARDTSTLSSASTRGGVEEGWARDGQNMFISERRWIKVVAHVVRRLWSMEGGVSHNVPARLRDGNPSSNPQPPATAAAVPPAPYAMGFQQPAWRPTGGGGGRGRGGGGGGGVHPARPRFLCEEEENMGETCSGLIASQSDTTGWGSAASGTTVDDGGGGGGWRGGGGGGGGGGALRAWEEQDGEEEEEGGGEGLGGEDWVGAGRSLAWAPGGEDGDRLFDRLDVDGGGGGGGASGRGGGEARGSGGFTQRRDSAAARQRHRSGGGAGAGAGGRGRRGGLDDVGKEGTRPAGMWEVTPPPHVAAMRRGGRGRDGSDRKSGPAYLRGVQSRIGPQVDAHKERLRKIANARSHAVRDVVARRRLADLDSSDQGFSGGGGVSGGGSGGLSAGDWDRRPGSSPSRGHTPGEHALDIANAFLESSLMTRLAGGDWFDGEDGDQPSTELSSAWGTDGAVRAPRRGRHPPPAGGVPKGMGGFEAGYGGRSRPPGSRHRRHGGALEAEVGAGAGVARRRVHTGWLGDFGPAHTHTVREMADDGHDDGDSGGGDDSGGGGGGGRGIEALGRFGFERDRGESGMLEEEEEEEEEEEGGQVGDEEDDEGRQAERDMYTEEEEEEEEEESEGRGEEGRRRRGSPRVEDSGVLSMSRRTGEDHLGRSDGVEAGVGEAGGATAGAAHEVADTSNSAARSTDIVSPRATQLEGDRRVRNGNSGGNANINNNPVGGNGGGGGGDDGGGGGGGGGGRR